MTTQERTARDLWAEHGWSLNGWQTGTILGLIVAASALARFCGW